MKNKQINKFLLMFFLSFTLFFSVSNAEFTTEGFTGSATNTYSSVNTSTEYSNYTLEQIASIFTNKDTSEENLGLYNTMVSSLNADGYNLVFWKNAASSKIEFAIWDKAYNIDLGTRSTGDKYVYASVDSGDNICVVIYSRVASVYTARDYTFTSSGLFLVSYDYKCSEICGVNTSIKYVTSSSNYWFWDGESYYYKAESDEPSILDDEIANIYEMLINSSDLSKRYSTHKRFFIVYDSDEDKYEAYFYPDKDLCLRYFNVDEYYEFVNYSNTPTGYIELSEKDMWSDFYPKDVSFTDIFSIMYKALVATLDSDNYWNYQVFKKYHWANKFLYNREIAGCNVWDEPGGLTLDLSYQQIVYTSHDIGNLVLTETDSTYVSTIVEETSIKQSELINSETGESYILSELPEQSTEEVTFWENLINTVVEKVFNFADMLANMFGGNAITLIFAIAIKAVTVLVSCVSLVFRFISFIMTLVAIPANSALLAVDVAATEGLVFTGLNWGKHFIDGLNFIKEFKWNGLGLWTLFEVFVSSLEVVLFVKIVRKHYKTL